MVVTMSPGRVALPSGMFSQVGISAIAFSGARMPASARIVPSTLPAPDMSYFISSISGPGLSEIPPVSKVMPLPTYTIGFCFFGPPMYLRTISFGGWREPRETARSAPMPSFSMSRCSRTS